MNTCKIYFCYTPIISRIDLFQSYTSSRMLR